MRPASAPKPHRHDPRGKSELTITMSVAEIGPAAEGSTLRGVVASWPVQRLLANGRALLPRPSSAGLALCRLAR